MLEASQEHDVSLLCSSQDVSSQDVSLPCNSQDLSLPCSSEDALLAAAREPPADWTPQQVREALPQQLFLSGQHALAWVAVAAAREG